MNAKELPNNTKYAVVVFLFFRFYFPQGFLSFF